MRIIPAGVIFLLAMAAQGQAVPPEQGRVEGRVRSATDGEPLPGASISFGANRSATANDSGHYALELPAGAYTATFRFIGFAEQRVGVNVLPGSTVEVDAAMQPSTSQLERVVVSAGRFEQRVGEVTQSLSILPAQLIQDKNTTNLGDALDQVPGVIVVDGDPQIRAGSGFSYGAGSRVMMLVDGLPILSGDIGRPNWTFLPVEDVEQVEVIKGASSVLYGSAALSGVIHVRTAWPGDVPKTRATVFAGMYDVPGHEPAKWWGAAPPVTGGASFTHAQRYGKFDLRIGGSAVGDQGYIGPERIAPDSLASDPYRLAAGGHDHRARFNFATRWRNQQVPGLNYGLNGNVMKSQVASVFIWDNLDKGLYRPLPNTTTTTLGTQFYLDPFVAYTGAKGTRHTLRGRWFHQDFQNNNDQSNANDMLHGEYQFQHKLELLGPATLTAGITGQAVNSHSQLYRGTADGSGENSATNVSGYLQLDKRLFEKLMLSAGVRYERFKVNDFEQAEPVFRAGATCQLFKATFVRASYGEGFRFPTIGERYILTTVGALHIYPNPELLPETSVNMEAGIKQGFKLGGIDGYVDLVAFQQDFDRYVEFTFGQWGEDRSLANLLGFGFKSVNTGGARISGTEVELAGRGKLGKVELQLLLGYTHTVPVSTTPHQAYASSVTTTGEEVEVTYANTSSYTQGNVLKFRVADLFRSDLGASWKRLSAGLSLRYNSHVRNIDEAFITFEELGLLDNIGVKDWMRSRTTGDWIADVRAGVALSPAVKLSFLVNNLGNAVHAIRPMAIEAPRSFQVQLACTL